MAFRDSTARNMIKNMTVDNTVKTLFEHNAYVYLKDMPVTVNYDDAVRSIIGTKRT